MASINPQKKKEFVRVSVPRGERVSSIVILILLAGIGTAILISGRHYDENRYMLDESKLEGTRATMTLADNLTESTDSLDAASTAGATPAAGAAEPIVLTVPGVEPMGALEVYGPDNLYEKINGQAEGYLEYKFRQLRVQSFSVGTGGAYFDIYDYDMSFPINAYGIYSLERPAQAEAVDFVRDGYRSGMNLYFQRGKHYVQVIASDLNPQTAPATQQAAEQAARELTAALAEDASGMEGRALLPVSGQRLGSVEFILNNAFGIPGIDNVFKAIYLYQEKNLQFFITAMADEAAAQKGFDSFRDFSAQFGAVQETVQIGGADLFVAESFGQYKVIYRRNNELGGVIDADDAAIARALVEAYLLDTLPQTGPAPALPAPDAPAATGEPEGYDGF